MENRVSERESVCGAHMGASTQHAPSHVPSSSYTTHRHRYRYRHRHRHRHIQDFRNVKSAFPK